MVFVANNIPGGSAGYTLTVLDTSARRVASLNPTNRKYGTYQLPEVSASDTKIYFLDGDYVLKSLSAEGVVSTVRTFAAPQNAQVSFAVSPDDRQIAVAVTGDTVDLYVEDLTGGNRSYLVKSAPSYEWPLGWHNGDLILAVLPGPANIQNYSDGFMNAYSELRLVDLTGKRLATLCQGGSTLPLYPVFAGGTWCWSGDLGGTPNLWSWTGSRLWSVPASNTCGAHGVLSPDGSAFAGEESVVESGGGCTGGSQPVLWRNDGSRRNLQFQGTVQAWVDDSHLYVFSGPNNEPGFYDLQTDGLTTLGAVDGVPVATMPGPS